MHIQREAGRVTINKQKDKPVSSKAQNPGPSGSAEQYSINQSIINRLLAGQRTQGLQDQLNNINQSIDEKINKLINQLSNQSIKCLSLIKIKATDLRSLPPHGIEGLAPLELKGYSCVSPLEFISIWRKVIKY